MQVEHAFENASRRGNHTKSLGLWRDSGHAQEAEARLDYREVTRASPSGLVRPIAWARDDELWPRPCHALVFRVADCYAFPCSPTWVLRILQ